MPRRPIAKKPARKKAPATKAKRIQDARKWWDHLNLRTKELETKVVEQAEYITKQERTIARLLSLLNNSPDGG